MARSFAITLGALASAISVGIGALEGAADEGVLLCAWVHLLVFVGVGYILGTIAEQVCQSSS